MFLNSQTGLGKNIKNQNEPKIVLENMKIKSINLGSSFTIILKTNGEIYVMGENTW